jgi:plasmid stability protein
MSVTLSIKNVPDDLADALRARARRNNRSIQGELVSILDQTVRRKPFAARAFLAKIEALRFQTPDEAVQMIREDRDSR